MISSRSSTAVVPSPSMSLGQSNGPGQVCVSSFPPPSPPPPSSAPSNANSQTVPLSVQVLTFSSSVPLAPKPNATEPPAAMTLFQPTSVTVVWSPFALQTPFHSDVIAGPPSQASVQPSITVSPRFSIVIEPLKPPSHDDVTAKVTSGGSVPRQVAARPDAASMAMVECRGMGRAYRQSGVGRPGFNGNGIGCAPDTPHSRSIPNDVRMSLNEQHPAETAGGGKRHKETPPAETAGGVRDKRIKCPVLGKSRVRNDASDRQGRPSPEGPRRQGRVRRCHPDDRRNSRQSVG